MSDARPVRYVVFNPSARVSVLQALKNLGRRDDVVALFDDLRSGPLDLSVLALRQRAISDLWRAEVQDGVIARQHMDFWPKALDPSARLIVWTTRHAVADHIGFLAWASRLGDTPAEVIDISDLLFADWRTPGATMRRAIPHLTPGDIVEGRLLDIARPIGADERAEATAAFERLVREPGAFRVIRDGALTTLPETAFDDALMAGVVDDWRKAARVVGDVLARLDETDGWPVGDLALAGRLEVLVETGRLECAGDMEKGIRYWEVRLPRPLSDEPA